MLVYTLITLVQGAFALPNLASNAHAPVPSPRDTGYGCSAWVTSPSPKGCSQHMGTVAIRNNINTHSELVTRDSKGDRMPELIEFLFLAGALVPPQSVIDVWNGNIERLFDSLSYADFSDWLKRSGEGAGYLRDMARAELSRYIACNLRLFDDLVGKWRGKGNKPFICICYGSSCCAKDEICPNPAAKHRLVRSPRLAAKSRNEQDSELVRRANDYPWTSSRGGTSYSGSYSAIAWPGPSDFAASDPIWQHVYAQALEDDCTLTWVRDYSRQEVINYVDTRDLGIDVIDFSQIEHWVEKNMLAKFTADVIAQRLPSGRTWATAANIPPTFFTQFMTTNQLNLQNVATVPGATNVLIPRVRIMHTLGSNTFRANFMLLQANINNLKEGILKGDNPVADASIQYTMTNLPRVFITYLRQVFGVLSYINNDDALAKGEATLRAIRWEWHSYATVFAPFVGGTVIPIVAAWDEWFKDFMQTRMMATRDWLLRWATDGQTHYGGSTRPEEQTAERVCSLYIDRAQGLGGYNDLTYPSGTPTPPP